MTRLWKIALVVLLGAFCFALLSASMAEDRGKDQKLTIEQLPAAVRATLESQAQGGTIQDLEKEQEDGVWFYSADIIRDGKKLEVEIAEDGKLLKPAAEAKDEAKEADNDDEGSEVDESNENEVKVTFEQLPPAVQATLTAQADGGKIDEIEKDTEDGEVVYSAEINTTDGRKLDVEIAADGKLLDSEVDVDDESGETD